MKYIKLFENYSSDYPFSITVEPTQKFVSLMKERKNSEGKPSYLLGTEFRLACEKGGRYNLVKVATTPYQLGNELFNGEKFNGRQDDYWLAYRPENSEIYLHTSRVFGTGFSFSDDSEITSTDRRFAASKDYYDQGLVWTGGSYYKFPEGFEVGMEDEHGYFKITKVEPFDN